MDEWKVWEHAARSVVGADSGYIVAWADPNAGSGIHLRAVRDTPTASTDYSDTATAIATTSLITGIGDRTLYPTMAYKPNNGIVIVNGSTSIGLSPDLRVYDTLHIANLAYQQGPSNEDRSQYIIYHRLGVKFALTSRSRHT